MLRRLLSLMSGSTLLTEAELADSLGVSLGEVEGMLAHLVGLGYVEDLAAAVAACGGACRGCPMRGSCHGGAARKVYSLTEKGRAASAS
jgi:hypothetical protein